MQNETVSVVIVDSVIVGVYSNHNIALIVEKAFLNDLTIRNVDIKEVDYITLD